MIPAASFSSTDRLYMDLVDAVCRYPLHTALAAVAEQRRAQRHPHAFLDAVIRLERDINSGLIRPR